MATKTPRRMSLRVQYEHAAQEYLRKLPLEHFMESTPHAIQRKITLESLDLVSARRPDCHVFNELLVQYPVPNRKRLGQVVPDNMVVIHAGPIDAVSNYAVPLQPVGPFWVLEYVSKSNRRKDYKDNMQKYEHDLKVPYYLLFDPDKQKMTLYRHDDEHFVKVTPDENGRCAIDELDMEVGLLDGWVRFWHQGELLPLPADLLRSLNETRRALEESQRQLAEAERELARLRARLNNGKH
jgi:Uma2 family endonuclease